MVGYIIIYCIIRKNRLLSIKIFNDDYNYKYKGYIYIICGEIRNFEWKLYYLLFC